MKVFMYEHFHTYPDRVVCNKYPMNADSIAEAKKRIKRAWGLMIPNEFGEWTDKGGYYESKANYNISSEYFRLYKEEVAHVRDA